VGQLPDPSLDAQSTPRASAVEKVPRTGIFVLEPDNAHARTDAKVRRESILAYRFVSFR